MVDEEKSKTFVSNKSAIIKVILLVASGASINLLLNYALFWATNKLWVSSLVSGAMVVTAMFWFIENYTREKMDENGELK